MCPSPLNPETTGAVEELVLKLECNSVIAWIELRPVSAVAVSLVCDIVPKEYVPDVALVAGRPISLPATPATLLSNVITTSEPADALSVVSLVAPYATGNIWEYTELSIDATVKLMDKPSPPVPLSLAVNVNWLPTVVPSVEEASPVALSKLYKIAEAVVTLATHAAWRASVTAWTLPKAEPWLVTTEVVTVALPTVSVRTSLAVKLISDVVAAEVSQTAEFLVVPMWRIAVEFPPSCAENVTPLAVALATLSASLRAATIFAVVSAVAVYLAGAPSPLI